MPALPQAAYDSLVWDLCSPRYGDTVEPAGMAAAGLLDYLTAEYAVVPDKDVAAPKQGTKDK